MAGTAFLMRILQVSTYDQAGGAETIAEALHAGYLARGHEVWTAVGVKQGGNPRVLRLGDARPGWEGFWRRWWWRITAPTFRRLGHENFAHPSTWGLLRLAPKRPELVHCHNLHGYVGKRPGYFDLRALPWLAERVPVILTLHDAWLLAGHCAHSFACERWETGCGECPDLGIYPSVRRDSTRRNWRLKRRIFQGCRLRVATPSRWLLDRIQRSMLAPAVLESRVIPNGVDLSVFRPGSQQAARAQLGLPPKAFVLLFAAHGARQNPWKDYPLLRQAVARLAAQEAAAELEFLALGEEAPPEQVGRAWIRFVPFQRDPRAVVAYYQAADVYIHAARADTFPLVVLEAQAAGCPVVATAVGGIPEQLEDTVTGRLTPPGDAGAMAEAVAGLLAQPTARAAMGLAAAARATRLYDRERQISAYLEWFQEILDVRRIGPSPPGSGRPRLAAPS